MKIVGSWKHRGGEPKPKQVQTILTSEQIVSVDRVSAEMRTSRVETLRRLWQAVIDNDDVEVRMEGLASDENLVSVSLTTEMYETIEAERGDIPRGTFLRALTRAGLVLEAERKKAELEGSDVNDEK